MNHAPQGASASLFECFSRSRGLKPDQEATLKRAKLWEQVQSHPG